MQKWEYLQEVVPLPQNIQRLNKLGQEGWELVSTTGPIMTQASALDTGQAVPGLILTCKRPLQGTPAGNRNGAMLAGKT
jgi:hypothetical protein